MQVTPKQILDSVVKDFAANRAADAKEQERDDKAAAAKRRATMQEGAQKALDGVAMRSVVPFRSLCTTLSQAEVDRFRRCLSLCACTIQPPNVDSISLKAACMP
jgi:hypothetical protein